MPTLSSLIVQRDVASMRTVEEAIARQVLHGGDLATNLLELSAVKEDALAWILAESHGLEPAPFGKLPPPDPSALRRIPGELALRHGLFPLSLDDKVLVVATSEPLSAAVEEDLTFALGVNIRQLAAPLVRVRQAIAEHYGIGLDRRFLRLLAKLDGRPDPSPSSMPPPLRGPGPMHMPRPASVPPPTFGTGGVGGFRPPAAGPAVSKTPVVAPVAVAPPHADVDPPALEAGSSQPVRPIPAPSITLAGLAAVVPPPQGAAPEGAAAHVAPDLAAAAAAATLADAGTIAAAAITPEPPATDAPGHPGDARAATADPRALAGWLRRAMVEERRGPGRPARRKGPFTAAMAEQELDEASSSDAVLDIYFDFAQQFFEYAVLFAVQGDLAEGRDASGRGADRGRVTGIGVPLDLPSTLALARDRRAPVLARFGAEGLDADLLRDLGRAPTGGARPKVSAVIPVVVRTRTVALLFGDDGAADVELSALGDLVVVTGLVAGALERVILRKKLGSFQSAEGLARARVRTPGKSTTRRGQPAAEGAAALARAFGATPAPAAAADAEADERPVPQVSPGAESVRMPAVDRSAPLPDVSPAAASARPHELAAAARDLGQADGGLDDDSGHAAFVGTMPDKSRAILPADLADAGWQPIGPRDDEVRRPAPVRTWENGRAAGGHSPPPSPLPPKPGSLPPIAPPPPTAAANRPLSRKPIPRQDEDGAHESPATAALLRAIETPPAHEVDRAASPRRSEGPPLGATARGVGKPVPSVIVDVDAEYASLLDRVVHGGPEADVAFSELVKHGDQAMPTIIASFPGLLRVDRHRARAELPAASQCGPVLELVVAIRRPALPFVTVRSTSADAEVRFWAVHVLGELRYPEAASALTPRLFDDDVAVRRIARRSAAALVNAGAAGQPIVVGLDHMTRNLDEPIGRRVMAIETMGEIRTGPLVPPLIAVLGDASDEVGDAARRALLLVTRQDLGRDARRWSEWWSKNGSRHRIEWLVDALMHDVPGIRRAAGDELKQLTKEYFGYYDDLPKKERERAQARYREWWEREGRAKFA